MSSRHPRAARLSLAACCVVALLSPGGAALVGAWRVVEATSTSPGGRTAARTQPSLRLFTQRHYSYTEVTATAARPELSAEPTDKEMAAAFFPFVAQAGAYVVVGNELTIRPIAAKNPSVMRPGSFTTYTLRWEDDRRVTLTSKETAAGPVRFPASTTLVRVE